MDWTIGSELEIVMDEEGQKGNEVEKQTVGNTGRRGRHWGIHPLDSERIVCRINTRDVGI